MKNIFIHIPKTGGSSFIGLLKDTFGYSQTSTPPTHLINTIEDTTIYHVDFKSTERTFKKPEIFNVDTRERFSSAKIFMLVRNPVERLISEFNFQFHLLNGKNGHPAAGIIQRLPEIPKDFEQYANFPHVHNYQTKFLSGRSLADPTPLNQEEFDQIIDTIEELSITCGITDEYNKFLTAFQNTTGIRLKTKLTVRKQTPQALKLSLPDATLEKIRDNNLFDYKLYEYIKSKQSKLKADNFKHLEPSKFTI
ncbi:sulfotransferase family protein [Parvicella tangerina]|uniref:Sulfotransferase family protein n=1 Tax=Parvicella tangerina TaxID=2829795 RepID=A0A916NGP3_9FLAO|nr:sulfotransferase family protein [Parvicella tangerina]CAG5080201.1 hypothetical protein CRYO30217_01217 [Parvicella tangerina]